MNNDLQKEIVELAKKQEEQKRKSEAFIKGLIISLIINGLLTGFIIAFTATNNDELGLSGWLKLITDAFSIFCSTILCHCSPGITPASYQKLIPLRLNANKSQYTLLKF